MLSKNNFKKKEVRVKLKKVNTYFKGLDAKSEDIMWTVFKEFYNETKGYGYTKGFIECNKKASNEYQDKLILMYGCNMFVSPIVMNFFQRRILKLMASDLLLMSCYNGFGAHAFVKGNPLICTYLLNECAMP